MGSADDLARAAYSEQRKGGKPKHKWRAFKQAEDEKYTHPNKN